MSDGIRVVRVFIKNILGVRELDFTPSDVTVVEGGSYTGKTSVIKTIKRGLVGGKGVVHLLHESPTGEVIDEGEIGIELEGSEGPVSIHETVTADKAELKVVRDGHPVTSPREYLKTLFDPYALNPIDFLTEDGKKRQKLLLDAMPLTLEAKDLVTAIGHEDLFLKATAGIEGGSHALTIIEAARKWVFDDRTQVNRSAKEKRGAADELHMALPPTAAEGTNWDEELESAKSDLDEEKTDRQAQISLAERSANTEIDTARKAMEQVIANAHKAFEKIVLDTQDATKVLLDSIEAEYGGKIEQAQKRVAQISAARDTHVAAEGSRKLLAKTVAEAERLEGESERRTTALENLDRLREKLLEKLPIKHITVQGGDVLWKGRPLEAASTTEQIGIVFQVAKLRAGKLKLMLIDRFESLDPAQRAAFIAAAKKMEGWQFICTQVTEGPLRLEAK